MFDYHAYGLRLKSDILLPFVEADNSGTSPASPAAEVFLRLEADAAVSGEPVNGQKVHWVISQEKARITVAGVGAFSILAGQEIRITPAAHFDDEMIRLMAMNSLLAVALFQRDALVLHASAVRIKNKAVAFLGASGAGKSTMAGALWVNGHVLVSDDITPVHFAEGITQVHPGYPLIKIQHAEADALGIARHRMLCLHRREQTYGCRLNERFSVKPVPLKHLFILEFGAGKSITRLSPRDAFMAITRNSAPVIWGLLPQQSLFARIGELVRTVPVHKISREKRLQTLLEQAAMIEEFVL